MKKVAALITFLLTLGCLHAFGQDAGPTFGDFLRNPFPGSYRGRVIYRFRNGGEQTDVWLLSVGKDGALFGGGNTIVGLHGSVNREGAIHLVGKSLNSTFAITGTVTKIESGNLRGTLVQHDCKDVAASIEIDLEFVLSYEVTRPTLPQPKPQAQNPRARLKLGNYRIVATEATEVTHSSGRVSRFQESVLLRIRIESIDGDGNVRAEVGRSNYSGRLKGRIDANGKIHLEGFIVSDVESKFILTATIADDTLTNGEYSLVSPSMVLGTRSRGMFNTAVLDVNN